MEAASTLPWCHVTSVLVPRCPLQRCAMPLSHQHSPPQGLPMRVYGLGLSTSSELRCAQRILDCLFHERAATSGFPHLGQLAEVLVGLPASLRPALRATTGFTKQRVQMEMSTHQQPKTRGVTGCRTSQSSSKPSPLQGQNMHCCTGEDAERCPWWVPGFVHCPAAVGPFGPYGV